MAQEKKKQLTLTECSWEEINQPGAYVSRDTGRLFRIPRSLGSRSFPCDPSRKRERRQICQDL